MRVFSDDLLAGVGEYGVVGGRGFADAAAEGVVLERDVGRAVVVCVGAGEAVVKVPNEAHVVRNAGATQERRDEGDVPFHVVLDVHVLSPLSRRDQFMRWTMSPRLRKGFVDERVPIADQRKVPGLILVPIRPVPAAP